MKKLLIAAALVMMGAGCQQPAPTTSTDSYSTDSAPSELTVPTSPEPQPAPVAEETSSNPPVSMNTELKFPGVLPASEISGKQIRMETSKGTIVFELFEKDAPLAVSNFVYLTNNGFYDGLTFHRREEGFVIQGGDPDGNGTGGPGWRFKEEPVTRPYDRGIVAMARTPQPSTNGSQFFIMLSDYPLPPDYTIFGKVTSGIEAVDKIKVGDKMTTVTVEAKK